MLDPYPEGREITLFLGGLRLGREMDAGQKLSLAMWKATREFQFEDCDIKVLAYSSGARVLSWAMLFGSPPVKTAVLAGASVSRWNPVIALRSQRVVNFWSREDFITRFFPIGGGAGSYGLLGADNKERPGRFHADWMLKRHITEDYVPELKK